MDGTERATPRENLNKYGHHVTRVKGVSMLPFLRQGKDTVQIAKGVPKKGEIALYECPDGKTCVLHRVIAVKGETFIFRGDNCIAKEYVPAQEVLGVLERVWRDGKEIELKSDKGYKAYSLLWRATAFIRIPYKKFKCALKRILKTEKSAK